MGPPHEPPRYVAFTRRDTQARLIDEDVGAIQQQPIGNRASVLVVAECLERHLCTEHKLRRSLFRLHPVDVAILRAVDAAETDAFRLSIVQDFDGGVVEKCYDRAGDIGSNGKREKSAKSKGGEIPVLQARRTYPCHAGLMWSSYKMQRTSSRDLSSLFQKIMRQTAYFRFFRDWHPEIGFPEWELGEMHVLL